MNVKIINSSGYPPISIHKIKAWNDNYSSFYPAYLFDILKASIKESGVIIPVALINRNGKWYCVDGLRRLQAVKELIAQGIWTHDFVPAVVQDTDNLEDIYAACAFQKKELSITQKAFFAAKWYYPEVKQLADENKKLNDNGLTVTQKIHTSLTVAQRVGLKTPDHVAKAYQLLQFDSWFYEFTYKQGFPFANTDVKELINLFKENKKHAEKIVQKMKELVENPESANEIKDIYKAAVQAVSIAENQCYNQSDIVTYEDIDIEDVVHINEVPHTQKTTSDNKSKKNTADYARLNQNQHIIHARKNLQIDINNEIIKAGSIGIVFQYEPPEDMLNLIKIALKNCRLEPTVINTTDEFKTFKEINCDETSTLQQEDNQ